MACVEWGGCIRLLLAGIGAGTVGTEKDPRPIMTLSCWGPDLPLKREQGPIRDD